MNNPLNELSAIYNQSIAEGSGCDDKKKSKVKAELSGTKRPDGGDGAAPNDGKNLLPTGNVPMGGSGAKRRASKYAVEPLATEEYKDLPKRKMGMKAGKKTLGAIGHALKTGTDGIGSIESQKRTQQADKKAKQADKIHNVAKSHNPQLSKMKSIKNRLTGMAKEGYAPGDVDKKVGAVTAIPKDERDAAKERLLAKAKAKRAAKLKEQEEKGKIGGGNLKKLATKATKRVDADVDGDVDTDDMKSSEMGEYLPSPDGKKKVKTKARFESYSSWRTDLREIVGNPADADNVEQPSPKKDTEAQKEIKEKKVKNKIKINPPQGVTEGFEQLGGVVIEMYELSEASYEAAAAEVNRRRAAEKAAKDKRMTITSADKKANTPAYQNYMKGDKRYKMVGEESEEEKKKREMLAKTKEHDDKHDGKMASEEMSVKDQMDLMKKHYKKNPPKDWKPGDRQRQRAAQMANAQKKSKPDTRTDSEKMADAYASPRKGPGGATRSD